ncbi:MAG TPA: efflux RND transporter permease subunit [Sandaracinaceae bacterium LLY-WYZ-13_1]|nr:efflux RND transporter permease subunit [Sandaracinaceae bacterium LLY-WYZ-13_1]
MSGEKTPAGGLLRVAVERPVTVVVTAVLVVLFGALSVLGLPIQLTPDIAVPQLTVRTDWPGASPTEVESEILEPQEDVLESVPGLVRMEGQARPDQATLTLEFAVGTDIEEALVRVTNRLTQVGDYPDAAQEPEVDTADGAGPPLAVIAIRSPTGEPVAAYRTWVDQNVLPELQRVPGIGEIRHIGGRDTVFLVEFDPRELAARGIAVPALAARLRTELADVSAGDVTLGRRRLLVRTMAVDPEPARLEDVVLRSGPDGTPVRLGDVARVSLGLRDATGVAMSDDRPSMVLLLDREAGTNVLEVTERIRERVAELDRERFQPEGLRIEVLSDQVDYIQGALDLVQQNLLIGAGLAVIVLFLFLRSFGASAIVSLAIPISVFGTALGMTLLGRSVNVVSLAGITFAIGMVLDNSIVSLESIDTWRRRVGDPKEAAFRGIREVWGALIASTATTAAVFVPVITWEGEVGQLLRDVAVAISFAVLTSLVVSVWVIPGLAGLALKASPTDAPSAPSLARRATDAVGRAVSWLIGARWRSALVVVGAVSACVAFAWAMLPPIEYLPKGNRNLVFGILVPPPGTSVEELERVGERVQTRVAAQTGDDVEEGPAIRRSFFVGGPERIFAGAVARDPERVDEMLGWLRRLQGEIPGYISFATQASLFGRAGGGRSIEVDLTGSDLGTLTRVGGAMFGRLQEAIPGAQIRPQPSLDPGAPELRAYPRRGEAAPLGVTTSDLGLTVDALVDGAIIGELGPEGEPQLDVVVRAVREGGERLDDPEDLRTAPVVTPGGEVVPLTVLAELREELGPTVIRRLERRRALTLAVAPPDEIPLETALARIEDEVIAPMRADGSLPGSVRVEYSGTAGDLEIAQGQFANVLLLALIISYLLMSALFEDFLAPIVVLVTLPLAAAGGVGALRLVDATLAAQPLDLMTALGFLILIGVVVNNAILVVDGALARLREGAALDDAVQGAVEARVRPILMTTLTSLAGLTPMVVLPGSGSELYRGVGAVVLGGLLLSTALTLFVVPSFFSLVWRVRLRIREARAGEPAPSPAE